MHQTQKMWETDSILQVLAPNLDFLWRRTSTNAQFIDEGYSMLHIVEEVRKGAVGGGEWLSGINGRSCGLPSIKRSRTQSVPQP